MGRLSNQKKSINHVAVIMDGNGRWALKNKVSKKKGHETGIKNCIQICKSLRKLDYNIREISFYVFSTENWKRSPYEINNLFSLIEEFYENFSNTADDNNLVIRHYGSKDNLSRRIKKIIDLVTERTKLNSGTFINLMFNYGSRKEINDAFAKMIKDKKRTKNIREYLYTKNSYDPDLIIRTGGEQRLSNFMLWQSAYAELYFTKTLWPDFKLRHLNYILHAYSQRARKLGK